MDDLSSTAYSEGWEAYWNNLDLEHNPYPESSWEYTEWNNGWNEADEEVMNKP